MYVVAVLLLPSQAPTPFLMGLHSGEPVDQRLLDMLVVADLDRGSLHLGKDDSLMKRCLSHPYMRRLERRIRCVFGAAGKALDSQRCWACCA
jgi:hypothetical protein